MSSVARSLATALRVARAEGLAAVRDRLFDRLADLRRDRRYRPVGEAEVGRFGAAVVNVIATPPSPRFGGVPTQLLARLCFEEKERPLALLYPTSRGYRLELTRGREKVRCDLQGAPHDPLGLRDHGFEGAVETALRITGAACLHVEGVAGLPLQSLRVLRTPERRLVLSVHDFALFCPRPHLLERPQERFCGYCRDPERCGRCLAVDWTVPPGFQAQRRAVAAELLAAADAVVYPSAFLRDRHAELFGPVDARRQHVIAPAVELPTPFAQRPAGTIRHVAYVGAVHAHKGALVFADVVEALASAPGLRFTVFGGGDPGLLARLARLPRVTVRGYYRVGSLPRLLRRAGVDLALLLSIWPESYGITLDECRAAGVPVVAFDHGAMGERLRCFGGGELVAPEQGAAGIARVVAEASLVEVARSSAGLPNPKAAAIAMAEVYRGVSQGPDARI